MRIAPYVTERRRIANVAFLLIFIIINRMIRALNHSIDSSDERSPGSQLFRIEGVSPTSPPKRSRHDDQLFRIEGAICIQGRNRFAYRAPDTQSKWGKATNNRAYYCSLPR